MNASAETDTGHDALSTRWRAIDITDERVVAGHQQMLESRAHRIAAGARCVGWKIGWNEPTTQARLGVASCALGYLLDTTRFSEGQRVDLVGGRLTGIEPELGITLDAGIEPGASLDEIGRAIGAVGVAVEVIDINARFDDLAAVLAGNIWHHSYRLGTTPARGTDRRLHDTVVNVTRNNQTAMIPVNVGEAIGDIRLAVRFVADSLDLLGLALHPGDLILSGLLTPLPIWVKPGDQTTVSMSHLGTVTLDFTTGPPA